MRISRVMVFSFCVLASGAVAGAAAQDRATLVADGEFSADQEAAQLFGRALDLDLGAPDSLWAQALVSLAATLRRNLNDPEGANLWLRWGARLHPAVLEFDNPSWDEDARGALQRILVEQEGAPEDSLIRWTFDWSGVQLAGNGTLRLNRQDVAPGVTVEVGTAGQLANQMAMAPGSYEIRVRSGDAVLARYEQEVLPGVTTTLNLNVPADVLAARMEELAAAGQLGAVAAGGGGFPVAVAVVGILGAGAAAALVLGKSSDSGGGPPGGNNNPTTGGIIINYPIR